jgi:hypothetical protein
MGEKPGVPAAGAPLSHPPTEPPPGVPEEEPEDGRQKVREPERKGDRRPPPHRHVESPSAVTPDRRSVVTGWNGVFYPRNDRVPRPGIAQDVNREPTTHRHQ